jgi:hypothetical protein
MVQEPGVWLFLFRAFLSPLKIKLNPGQENPQETSSHFNLQAIFERKIRSPAKTKTQHQL